MTRYVCTYAILVCLQVGPFDSASNPSPTCQMQLNSFIQWSGLTLGLFCLLCCRTRHRPTITGARERTGRRKNEHCMPSSRLQKSQAIWPCALPDSSCVCLLLLLVARSLWDWRFLKDWHTPCMLVGRALAMLVPALLRSNQAYLEAIGHYTTGVKFRQH